MINKNNPLAIKKKKILYESFSLEIMNKKFRRTKTFSSKRSLSKKYAKNMRRINRKARY